MSYSTSLGFHAAPLCFSFINLFNGFIIYPHSFTYPFTLPVAWMSLGILFMYFTKSAQIPFCSRLINATAAPTPMPALLHSSTTVIAGVYLGLMLDGLTLLFMDSYEVFFVMMLLYPIYSLLWSLFSAMSLSDTKPIIANPTISQISHIFLALLMFPSFSLFHIIVHALFKPMLFLLAGSPIHITSNFQSMYSTKLNNALMSMVYILGVLILIFNYSKEGMIHSSNMEYASSFVCMMGLMGAVFTSMHSLKIYTIALMIGFYSSGSWIPDQYNDWFYSFSSLSPSLQVSEYPSAAAGSDQSSFVLPVLTLSEMLMDQGLDICFTSTSLYYSLDWCSLFCFSTFDYAGHYSLLFILLTPLLLSSIVFIITCVAEINSL